MLQLHTPTVWASLVEGAKEAGPGHGPGGQGAGAWGAGAGQDPGGQSLDAQVRGKGRMQRAQGWDRVQLGLDLLG